MTTNGKRLTKDETSELLGTARQTDQLRQEDLRLCANIALRV